MLSAQVLDSQEHSIKNHYANISMQYTVIFHGCENDNFQIKNCNIFDIFAQNID